MFKNGLVVEMAKLIVLKAPWNLILHLMAKTARLSLLFVGDTPGTVASLIFILLITSPCWLVGCIFLQFTDLLRFSDPDVYWAQNHLFGCFYLQVGISSFSLAIIVIPIAFSMGGGGAKGCGRGDGLKWDGGMVLGTPKSSM